MFSLRSPLARAHAHSRPGTKQRRAALGAAVLLLASVLVGARSVEATFALWTDEESAGSSLQAGVVPTPSVVDCRFPQRTFNQHRFDNLIVEWESPQDDFTIQPESYRLDFVASGSATPAPSSPTTGLVGGSYYADFGAYLSDPPTGLVRSRTHTYRIHLIAVGPGGWESEPRVIEVSTSLIQAVIPFRSSSCRVVEPGGGVVTFQEDRAESMPEPERDDEAVEEGLSEEESEVEDDEPTETTPTEDASEAVDEDVTQAPSPSSETSSPRQPAPSDPESPSPSYEESEAPSHEETATETPPDAHEDRDSETVED